MALAAVFRYRKTSVSILMVSTLALCFFVQSFMSNRAIWAPHSPLLDSTWSHLQAISSSKHPFTSPNNDDVHEYLLGSIENIVKNVTWAQVVPDNQSIFINQQDVFNSSNKASRLIYYESSNIYVEIEGADPSLDGLLISAHYDSVPTSSGTIDDGMGIASMLGALEDLAASNIQPQRTLIFNFNNNEEFGLLGAEAFVKSKLFGKVKYFLNLEGTGSGKYAKPILFRGTDKSVLDWYKHVTYPFASSTFMQGFKDGLIKSETDYHVYSKVGLRGIDIAFFEPRSWYHTYRDNVKWTSKGSLWMMLANTIDIIHHVGFKAGKDVKPTASVFLDIVDKYYINVDLSGVFKFNIFIAIIYPIVNFFLLKKINSTKRKAWFVSYRGWLRFPGTVLATILVNSYFISLWRKWNPLLISHSYISIISQFALISIIIGYFILKFSQIALPIHDQKLHIILELNGFLWLATCYTIYKLTNRGGESVSCLMIYIPLLYTLTELSILVGIFGLWARKVGKYEKNDEEVVIVDHMDSNDHTVTESYSSIHISPEQEHNSLHADDGTLVQEIPHDDQHDASESTPLAPVTTSSSNQGYKTYEEFLKGERKRALKSPQYEWPLQFFLLVPIPMFITLREGLLVTLALHEIVQESGSFDHIVWQICCLVGSLVGSLTWIWADKLRATLITMVLILLLGLNAQMVFQGMFAGISYGTDEYPLKVRYVQEFNVTGNSSQSVVYGRAPYLERILTDLPNIVTPDLRCETNDFYSMQTCKFEGERPWLLSGSLKDNDYANYLNVDVLSNTNENKDKDTDKYSTHESIVQIQTKLARQCHISFLTPDPKVPLPVKALTVYKGDNWREDFNSTSKKIPQGISQDENGNWSGRVTTGITDLTLHKLAWSSNGVGSEKPDSKGNNVFTVKLEWLPFVYDDNFIHIDHLNLVVSCQWSDFDQESAVDGQFKTRVPVMTELIDQSPLDVSFTNLKSGVLDGSFDVIL